MMYGLLNSFLSGANSTGSRESESTTCDGYDPESEDRKEFEAKLDGKASPRDKPN
jgi:hypothetical protein